MQRSRGPKAIKQKDLLMVVCSECGGEGRVPIGVTLPRGGCRGFVEYGTCPICEGRGGFNVKPERGQHR